MGIVTNLLRRERKQEPPEEPVATIVADAGPSLMVLLPDAGGIAAYQLHSFPSAKAAELYIDSTLRGQFLGASSPFGRSRTPRPSMARSCWC